VALHPDVAIAGEVDQIPGGTRERLEVANDWSRGGGPDTTVSAEESEPRHVAERPCRSSCEHVERLIAEGTMQPSGLRHVEAAKQDGRWDNAYAGSAEMVIPKDFLSALAKNPPAQFAFKKLSRAELFTIYQQLQTARTPETRARRMAKLLTKLADTETPPSPANAPDGT